MRPLQRRSSRRRGATVLRALESDVSGEVFQIATGTETSIIDLAGMVQQVVDRDVERHHGPPRQGDIGRNYSAIAKVRERLGWPAYHEAGRRTVQDARVV